jgi:hypothetical protein
MVKRSLLLASSSLLIACAAFAWVPVFPVNQVVVRSGEQSRVPVKAAWSGLDPTWTEYHCEFFSADEHVAIVEGSLQSPAPEGIIIVTGVEPGDTTMRIGRNGDWAWLSIHVVCGAETPVIAAKPVVTTLPGQVVSLLAITPMASSTVFQWYSGRIGDTSQPIKDGGASPELRWIAEAAGTSYVWVEARTVCFASRTEFRIDIAPVRRRSAGH